MSTSTNILETSLEKSSVQVRLKTAIHSVLWCLIAMLIAWRFGNKMDSYEIGIGLAALAGVMFIAHYWRAFSISALIACLGAWLATTLYQGHLESAQQKFLLKFILSSQSAMSWMSVMYFLSWGSYALGSFIRSPFSWKVGNFFAWSGATLALTGLLVRWHESYLYGAEIGHIPISNLYEVLVVFCLFTTWIYLYFEYRYNRKELGAWAMGVLSAWVLFLLWYGMSRQAQEIQPLVPALQSYWMKIHVPANFIGYGGFTVAAMTGLVVLVGRARKQPIIEENILMEWMYRSISVGFAFFTIATILGAIWAAEAWGGYWSWDPKEVWALIVWLNYAAWLHFRLTKGNQTKVLAIWSVLGFFITLFAFLGVNIFLSGLHSYGKL
ncbi:MAG: c-type cytochrome biogenesis protein CcsB [Pseudomonadota bacterium]